MKLLVVVSNYPHSGHRFSGIFNERSVAALKDHCEFVAVLAPRPYIPKLLTKFLPGGRWEAYGEAQSSHMHQGVPVHRPPYLQIPRIASSFWQDQGAYVCALSTARNLHARCRFDAILSFGVDSAGGLAWRLARRFGIPVAVWATGSDMRKAEGTAPYRSVKRTLRNADLVIYQSRELLEIGARIIKVSPSSLPGTKHVVLSRGIAQPPLLAKDEARKRERLAFGVADDEILILFIGRVTRSKGMSELIEAMALAISQNPKLQCRIVGAKPAFDETATVEKKLDETPGLRNHVRLLPACDPEKVWEHLCAADIFAFPSHNEGMPNSLLEAMVMGVPSVAFAIPAIKELEAGTGAVALVPPLDAALFAETILRLAASPDERVRIAESGRDQAMKRFMIRTNMRNACAHLAGIVGERADSAPTSETIFEKTQRDSAVVNLDSND